MRKRKHGTSDRQAARPASTRRVRWDGGHRRLVLEAIEERVLLSAGTSLTSNPTLTMVGPNVALLSTPTVGSNLGSYRLAGYLDVTGQAITGACSSAPLAIYSNGSSVIVGRFTGTVASDSYYKVDLSLVDVIHSSLSPDGATNAVIDFSGSGTAGNGGTTWRITIDANLPLPSLSDPPAQPAPGSTPRPAENRLAGGLIDLTPRPGDPVHLVAAVSVPAVAAQPFDPRPTSRVDGPREAQLATPWQQIEGTRGREQTFDIAMIGPNSASSRLTASAATGDVLGQPDRALHSAPAISGIADELTTVPAPGTPSSTSASAMDSRTAPAASVLPAANLVAASIVANADQAATGVYAGMDAVAPAAPTAPAAGGAGDTVPAWRKAIAELATSVEEGVLSHVALLDGNWAKSAVGVLAVALVSRQLVEASSPSEAERRNEILVGAADKRLTKLPW